MSNPYLDALQSTSLATGAAEPPNPYLDLLQGAEDARKAQQAAQLSQAVKVDPNQYSAQRRVAQYLGYPVAAAEALPGLADQAKVQKVQQDTASSPLLQQRYSDADFAKLAHDDSGTLAQLGKFVGDLGGSMKAGVFRASRGAAGTFQAGFELIAPALDFLEPVTVVGGNPLRRLAEGFAMQGEAAGRTAALARPKTDGIVAGGFFSGVESLTQNLLTLPMALLPGGQAAALTGMTAFTGGDAYQQAREKGLPMSQALPFAASQAAIEYATEKLPLGKLLQDVKAGAGFLRILGRQIALEVPGEQIATVLQDLNDWAVLNPEKPFSTYLEERPSAAAQTLIATIVGTGGNVAVVKGLETMMSRAVRDGANMQQAGLVGQALQQAMAGAEASLLRERSPEQFRTLMSEMSEDGSLYVDAAVLNQMPAEVLAQLPGVTEALQTATADTPVEVKLADALTVLPGTPEAQVFLQNARTAPDAPSLAEAEAAGQKAQEFLQQEAARVIEQAQDQEALRQSQEAVKQNIRQQLAATGRFRDAVNEGYATWAAAFYTAYGSRLGMTPEEFYQRYPLRVLGAAQGQQTGVLNAGAASVTVRLGERDVPVKLGALDAQRGNVLVPVKAAAFDAAWRAGDTFNSFYIGPGGVGNTIGERYPQFGEFASTASSINASVVSVDENGVVGFGDGRHRFAFMRDQGVQTIPVAMDAESLQNAIAAGYVEQGVFNQAAVERLQMVAERGVRATGTRSIISAQERAAIDASAKAVGMPVAELETIVRNHKLAHPAAQGWDPLVYVRSVLKDGKVLHQYQNSPYTFSVDADGKQLEPGSAAYTRRVNAVARAMVDEVRTVFRRAADGDKNAQNILAQAGWYKAMRARLRKEFGGLGDLFADLLGATSPNTPVRDNWFNAVDALRRASRGDFDRLILQWEAWADNLDALETDLRGWFNGKLAEGLSKKAIKDLPEYQQKLDAVRAARDLPDELLPAKESGAKYGFNGRNVARAMVDLWRVVKNADPDIARGGTAPKALNFSGNLIGFRSRATIDVWAARMLQRLAGGRRIASMAETGVSGEMREDASTTLQFGLGQDVFGVAARAIRDDAELKTNDTLAKINDDDLQAVVWFIEKEVWTVNDWTNAAGEGGSFELEANLTGTSQQDRVKELRSIIDASPPSADVTAAAQDTSAALKAIEDHERQNPAEIAELGKLESGEIAPYKGSKKRMGELQKLVRPPAEATRLLGSVERAKARLEAFNARKVAAKAELAALEREVDRFVGGLSIQMSQETQGKDFVPTDADMARLAQSIRLSIYEADDGNTVLGSKALSTEGRYGGVERSLDLEVVAREGYDANKLWLEMLRQAQAAKQDSTFLSRVLRANEEYDPLTHRPGVEIYFRSAASQAQLEKVLADLAKEGVEFLTVIVDGRRLADTIGGAMPAAVGVRLQYVPEFEQRYGMDNFGGLDDLALAAKMEEKAAELRAIADRVSDAVEGVSFAGQFWYETQVAFSSQYQEKIDALTTGVTEEGAAGAAGRQQWAGDSVRAGLEGADRQSRETAGGEPGADVLGGDAQLAQAPTAQVAPAADTLQQGATLAQENIDDLLAEYARPAATRMDAERAFADGDRLFVVHEQAEEAREVFSVNDLAPFTPDQILILPASATLEQGARGTFNPQTLELVLNPNADLSTWFHETGHFFLEVLADVASQPDAPAQIVEDYNKVLAWFGVTPEQWAGYSLDEKRPYHERWAESIEQYVMEGKAPSVELQGVMRRFRAWLTSVYQSIKQFLAQRGVPVAGGEALNQMPAVEVTRVLYRGTTGSAERIKGGIAEGTLFAAADESTARSYAGTGGAVEQIGVRPGAKILVEGSAEFAKVTGRKRGRLINTMRKGENLKTAADAVAEQARSAGYDAIEFTSMRDLGIAIFNEAMFVRDLYGASTVQVGENLLQNEAGNRTSAGEKQGVTTGYGTVQVGPPMALNDDIRRVMDRMLATDEQIAQANEVAGLMPDEQADGEAAERLQKRSMADLKWAVKARDKVIAKLKRQAREIEKGIREQVTVEVDQMPEMRAKAALDALAVTPEYAGILAEHKARRLAAEVQARKEITDAAVAAEEAKGGELKGLKKGQFLAKMKREIGNQVEARMIEWDRANPRPARPVNATDQDLATIADSFGYESVDAMLQAIDAFGKRADAIDGLTERRMLEEHGDLVDEAAIQEAANEAVHNEARARSLATELRTQREMLGQRTDTGQTNARGARITVNTLVEAAKQFGANVIARTPLKDLRSTAWKHTAAERRAGKRWAEATAAGDTQAAVQAKQDQMLNNAAAKAALDAATEAKKILEFFARVTKGNDEKTVEKGRDPDIVNAARAVLAAYGIETPTTKGAAAYLETVKTNDPDTYAAIEPMIAVATQNAQPLEALTFEELQGLAESIRAMWFLAKRSRQMEVDGDLMDIDDVAGELFARLDAIGIPDRVPGEGMAVTKEEERGLFLKQGIAFLRRVEQWAEGMDGKYGGPFLRYVFQPIKDAADRYRKDRIAYRKKFQALVDNLAPIVSDSVIQAPELGYTFGTPGSTAGTAMNEILHAIAHTGNESNKRKLLLGRGWATENPDGTLDTSRWDAFLQRLANEGKLERAHYDFVQGVWDLLEETKPLAQKAHRDAFGRYFSEVTADAFVDPFGVTRRGGYVPAQVDSRLVKDNVLRKMAEEENNSMAYAFPQPAKGFTMARTEYNRPLMLDLRSLSQHLDKVLLFSHMTNPARDVRKLITRKTVSQPLDRIQPAAIESMLQPWLQRSAQQVVEDPIVGAGKWARVPSVIRARAGMALMFANVSNAIQQVTGLSSAAVRVKPAFLMRSLAQYITHPVKFSQAVWAASPYMDDRAKNEVAVMNEQMQAILIQPSTYEKVKDWSMRHAYFLQTALDNVLSPIVWTGAFNQALAEGMSDADAVRFADGTVRQTQGSTLPEDVSRFETGPAYARAFTQFVGYFNMVANTNATALKQIAGEVGLKKGAGRAFSVVMLGLLAPIWMAEAIALAFKGGPDDEDEDGSIIDDWVASVFGFGTAKGLLAMIPILGQAANSAVTRLDNNPMNDRISLSPGLSLLESALGGNVQTVYELLNDEKEVNARRAVRDAATLVSVFTGVPVYALARPAGYAAGVAQGKIEPTGPVDVARGLLTGTASPESKAR